MTTLSSIRLTSIEDAGAGGVTVYATPSLLPTTGMTAGDQAFVTSNQRLYISTGSGWYNVALINSTPTFTTSPDATYALSTDLTPTVITLLAQDSDGQIVTYSATDSGMDGIATLSQDSSVFTITPLTDSAGGDIGTFTITFQATDGIGITSALSTFSLSFGTDWTSGTITPDIVSYAIGPNNWKNAGFSPDGSRALLYQQSDFATYSGIIAVADRGDSDLDWSYTTRLYGNNNSGDVINDYTVSNVQWYVPFSNTDYTKTNLWSGDGTRVVVPNAYYYGSSGRGRITVWKDTAGTWSIEQDIEETNAWRWGSGGASIDSDGLFFTTAGMLVGTGAGNDRIRIYSRSGSTWSAYQTLNAANTYTTNTGQYWSYSQLSKNSLTLVGVYSTSQTRSPTPQISIFTRANTSSSFSHVYTFTTDSTYNGNAYNNSNTLTSKFGSGYGNALAMSGDGNTVAICEREADTPIGNRYGRLHIFRNVNGTWTRVGNLYLSSNDMAVSSASSWPISTTMSNDGNTIAAFDWLCDTNGLTNNGRTYVFTNGATDTDWNLSHTIDGPEANLTPGVNGVHWPDDELNDNFYSVGPAGKFLINFQLT